MPGLHEHEDNADEIALCAATLADEDDSTTELAIKLMTRLRISAVEVTDDDGNGSVLQS